MQSRKRPLKKIHLTRKSVRRGLSLLLCLCMAVSLFGSVIAFPAFAQGPGQEAELAEGAQQEPPVVSPAETREKIKARLLRQAMYEGWDPYSATGMSMDEFYALMELFQEGSLPLAEAVPAPDFNDPAPEPSFPKTPTPDFNNPYILGPDTVLPGANSPYTLGPDTVLPGVGTGLPSLDGPSFDGSVIADTLDTVLTYIPRELFLFSGLTVTSTPAAGNTYGPPLSYDNINGNLNDDYYPKGLDPTHSGYTRPPKDWPGLALGESLETQITVPRINDNDPAVAGDVNQSLFLAYNSVYVRRVTAQNSDVTILGAIKPLKSNNWVYYYTTRDDQSTQVSATTLLEGEKFIVQYVHQEHNISYQIRYRATEEELHNSDHVNLWGYELVRNSEDPYYDDFRKYNKDYPKSNPSADADIADWVRQLPELADKNVREDMAKAIFGTDFPTSTDEGRYAFTATAPNGFTLAFYLSDKREDTIGDEKPDTWVNGQAMLVTEEGYKGGPGKYTSVNQGWALGMEPVYNIKDESNGYKVLPNEKEGPQELVTTGTFYNNDVTSDRIVVAVLRRKPTPKFDAKTIIDKSSGADNRGTSAVRKVQVNTRDDPNGEKIPVTYDYEDEYLWRKYGMNGKGGTNEKPGSPISKYINYPSSEGGLGNIRTADSWQWKGKLNDSVSDTMTLEDDGTYSFQWTFQTNSGNFLLDVLEINRVGVIIPFFSKYSEINGTDEYPAPDPDPDGPGGIRSWFAYTKLPDGAIVKVEYLAAFGNVQRVYRITVTGARNDVTITGLNLNMYSQGAAEISVYHLDGITGATVKDGDGNTSDVRLTAMQHYQKNDTWSGNKTKAQVLVHENKPGSFNFNGDASYGGANIRFKLAEGYSNPYYLLESSRYGTIPGSDNTPQASAKRNSDGEVERGSQNPVIPYISDGDDPFMRYDNRLDDNGNPVHIPVPVNNEGKWLYYYDSNGNFVQFTDPSALRVRAETTGNVLAPELYLSTDGSEETKSGPLAASTVIALKNTPTFQWDGDKPLLDSRYIYSDAGGWHYVRLTGQQSYKVSLLTIVAFPSRYVIRYKPGMIPAVTGDNNEVIEAERPPQNIPQFNHKSTCPTFLQGDPGDDRLKYEFDDNSGFFYDVQTYTGAAIDLTRPYDEAQYYRFVDWVLVDEDDIPVRQHVVDPENPDRWLTDSDGNYVTQEAHFSSGAINIEQYREHAILNGDLGTTANDIYVLRLMPTWELIENRFNYKVALNWVDAQGVLHAEYFDDESENSLWQSVLTDHVQTDAGLAVKVLTNTEPFQDWIARHPTYSFWDAVNNAAGDNAEDQIREALLKYFPKRDELNKEDQEAWDKNYNDALTAILNRDRKYKESDKNKDRYQEGPDFDPLGNYTYTVYQDYGTIAVWMFEDKGGLVFHKSVDAEPFIADDEFYFTVRQVMVGADGDAPLTGEYKAYPAKVYDEVPGEERAVKDRDAWLVKFKDGSIINIVKNDGSPWPAAGKEVNYFTVKNGESIRLYVPGGKYTISELGSKSGGSYWTEVTYVDAETGYEMRPKTGWDLPTGHQWLKGDRKTFEGANQVSATVNFVVGEHDVARIINFSNQTSAASFENLVIGPYQGEQLGYTVTLILPKDAAPLYDEDEAGDYYYFNFNLYDVTYPEGMEAKYKDEYFPGKWNYPDEFVPPPRVGPDSPGYQDWWNWHNWRPDGTLSANTTGRVVVKKDEGYVDPDNRGTTKWDAQHLLIPETGPTGIITDWNQSTYSGTGVIGLKSGQRFYVVCTVPDSGADINYIITESDTRGYAPGGGRPRIRTGKAVAAELAYELFKNSKLQGLPATGGMGYGAFRAAGLAFLASGLGLAWLNRDLLKRKRRASVPAEEKGWGK